MSPTQPLEDEARRLAALHRSGLLATPDEQCFDIITALAARLLGAPVSLISLLDADRQWIKSSHGLGMRELLRAGSLCAHVVATGRPVVSADTLHDPRFADSLLVRHPPHVRAYAGHPLRDADGMVLGTLCVFDTRPREFADSQLVRLHELACMAETYFGSRPADTARGRLVLNLPAVRRELLIDPQLRIWNHAGLRELLRWQVQLAQESARSFSVCLFDFEQLDGGTDSFTRPVGDVLLRRMALAMRAALQPTDELGRHGDRQFLVLLPDTDLPAAREMAAAMADRAGAQSVLVDHRPFSCRVSAGVAAWAPEDPEPIGSLLRRAEDALLAGQPASSAWRMRSASSWRR